MCLVQTVSDKLSTWLNYECRSRGWSHRQLGDRSGISGAMISRVIAEKQSAGWDFCKAMADALGKDPVEVFIMAGLLPEESHGEDEPALLHHYRQLSPGNQRAALAMLRGLAGLDQRRAATRARYARGGLSEADLDAILAEIDLATLETRAEIAGLVAARDTARAAAAGAESIRAMIAGWRVTLAEIDVAPADMAGLSEADQEDIYRARQEIVRGVAVAVRVWGVERFEVEVAGW